MAEFESIEIDMQRYNETEETILSMNDIDVVIDFYWDSHGKLVEFRGPNDEQREELHVDTIRIIERSYDVKYEFSENLISCVAYDIYINGKLQPFSFDSYVIRKRLFIKAIVGWG